LPASGFDLAAGRFWGAFLNTAFAQRKQRDSTTGWGKGRIITDHLEAGDINHWQCSIPVFVEEVEGNTGS